MPGAPATVEIHGIGTAVLDLRVHEGRNHKPSRKLTLHNVLYMPNGPANVFAFLHLLQQNSGLNICARAAAEVQPIQEMATGRVVGLIVNGRQPRL